MKPFLVLTLAAVALMLGVGFAEDAPKPRIVSPAELAAHVGEVCVMMMGS